MLYSLTFSFRMFLLLALFSRSQEDRSTFSCHSLQISREFWWSFGGVFALALEHAVLLKLTDVILLRKTHPAFSIHFTRASRRYLSITPVIIDEIHSHLSIAITTPGMSRPQRQPCFKGIFLSLNSYLYRE